MQPANSRKYCGHLCGTAATCGLLQDIGIELSELKLFGPGDELGYMLKCKKMDFPYIRGRIKPDFVVNRLACSI